MDTNTDLGSNVVYFVLISIYKVTYNLLWGGAVIVTRIANNIAQGACMIIGIG